MGMDVWVMGMGKELVCNVGNSTPVSIYRSGHGCSEWEYNGEASGMERES